MAEAMADMVGMAEVTKAIQEVAKKSETALRRGLSRIGLVARSTAKSYAPRSPTNAQISATLKRKKRTARKGFPGNLEKSIEWELVGRSPSMAVSVFVAANGYTRTSRGFNYAPKIHDERGMSWHNLGPGSIAKNTNGKVGEKFIERAIRDRSADFLKILQDEAAKEAAST